MSAIQYQRLPASLSTDREFVSRAQHALLLALEPKLPASFNVNEGHRTMARQQQLYDLYRSGRGNLAAVPSDTAPHIKTGHANHALDCQQPSALADAARHVGIDYRWTVPSEGWHIEPDEDDLARWAAAAGAQRRKAVHAAKVRVRRTRRVVLRATGRLKRAKKKHAAARVALQGARS